MTMTHVRPCTLAAWALLSLASSGCLARWSPNDKPLAKPGSIGTNGTTGGLSRDEQHLLEASRIYPLAEYLQDCEQALGIAPALSCSDAVPYDYGVLEHAKTSGGLDMCAHPTLNNPMHSCVPGTGVARYTATLTGSSGPETVDWILICSKVLPDPKPNRYHALDVIGYNRTSGQTCFFKNAEAEAERVTIDGKKLYSIDGSKLSPLTAQGTVASIRAGSRQSWAMPFGTAGNCTTCHSNGPWLRSFVHRGLKGPDGQPLVPARKAKAPEPYRIVGKERLRQAAGDFVASDAHHTLRTDPKNHWDPRWLANTRVTETCGACHTVGNEHYCEINVKAAYGDMNSETRQIQDFSRRLITRNELANRPQNSAGGTQVVSAEAWHRSLHRAGPLADPKHLSSVLGEIRSCCDTPHRPECQWLTPESYKARLLEKGSSSP